MKTRKYLRVIVYNSDGTSYSNPLKFSEVYLIIKMVKEHGMVEISLAETTESNYKSIFG